MIGIFQAQPGGAKRLRFKTNIQGLKTPDGKRILEPTKVRSRSVSLYGMLSNRLHRSCYTSRIRPWSLPTRSTPPRSIDST